jgi:hypothetical protein
MTTPVAATTRGTDWRVRTARRDDREAIRRIFSSTLVLGRPLTVDGLSAYADFSLGWYLDCAESASVHLERHRVTGYVLICTDEATFDAHQRRAAVTYVAALARLAAGGRLGPDARRFHRLRLRDGWALHRHSPERPADAHIHLNLLPGARATQAGRRLVDEADRVVGDAGHDAWYAQINAPVGRRADALVRLGAEVVHRDENRTLSELVGRPVERLTIVRKL